MIKVSFALISIMLCVTATFSFEGKGGEIFHIHMSIAKTVKCSCNWRKEGREPSTKRVLEDVDETSFVAKKR